VAGCRADVRVEIEMHGDGTGVVHAALRLDEDAVRIIGGLDAANREMRVDDLVAAGWTVSPLEATPEGGARVTFSHPYSGEADLAARLADLVGEGGVVREPSMVRERGWLRSRDALSLVVDLRAPTTGIGSDADLQARLAAAGVDPAYFDEQLTEALREALNVSVAVRLPNGEVRERSVDVGTMTTLRASERQMDYDQFVKVGIAATLALLAGLFLLAARASARRERRRNAARVAYVEHERAPLM
jgi:hypothetical protein